MLFDISQNMQESNTHSLFPFDLIPGSFWRGRVTQLAGLCIRDLRFGARGSALQVVWTVEVLAVDVGVLIRLKKVWLLQYLKLTQLSGVKH